MLSLQVVKFITSEHTFQKHCFHFCVFKRRVVPKVRQEGQTYVVNSGTDRPVLKVRLFCFTKFISSNRFCKRTDEGDPLFLPKVNKEFVKATKVFQEMLPSIKTPKLLCFTGPGDTIGAINVALK